MSLHNVRTQDLASELGSRSDLIDNRGRINFTEVYNLLTKLSPIPCSDGVPVRFNQGIVEGALIVRGTGLYRGKYAMVGGRIAYEQDLREALKVHFLTDLGLPMTLLSDWHHPDYVYQYHPKIGQKDFGHDPSKHAIGLTYLVSIPNRSPRFGSSVHGDQEALNLHWFSSTNCPPSEMFAFNHNVAWKACLEKAMGDPVIMSKLNGR